MKKRKTSVYIDRSKSITESSKCPNVDPRAAAIPCNNHFKSPYRLFKYKIVVPGAIQPGDMMLDSMMMKNELAVLMLGEDYVNSIIAQIDEGNDLIVEKIAFNQVLDTDAVSGKRKKGAQTLKAGSVVCSITYQSGLVHQLKAPVGGQLLELNNEINSIITNEHPEATAKSILQRIQKAYIAVILPNTVVPTVEGHPNWEALMAHIKDTTTNICFAFVRGQCKRGSNCKFQHTESAIALPDKAIVIDEQDDADE